MKPLARRGIDELQQVIRKLYRHPGAGFRCVDRKLFSLDVLPSDYNDVGSPQARQKHELHRQPLRSANLVLCAKCFHVVDGPGRKAKRANIVDLKPKQRSGGAA